MIVLRFIKYWTERRIKLFGITICYVEKFQFHTNTLFCVLVVTLLLFSTGFRWAANLSKCRTFKLCSALLHPGRQFHSFITKSQAIHHHRIYVTGYLFCSGANCLQLIIANLGACNEGGVSSLSSNPLASSQLYLLYR